MSAEISFYSRGGSIPCSLKAQVTATYVTNSGEFIVKKSMSLFGARFWTLLRKVLDSNWKFDCDDVHY